MPKIALLDNKGEKIKDIELNKDVWAIEPNDQVIYNAVIAASAAQRQGTHKTKIRSEVSGGGRKPWRQKGTGNARQGSIRSPQWRGGGVVFGPQPRSYAKKMNKKERRLALASALSYKIINKELVVVDKFNTDDNKTSTMIKYLDTLKVSGKTLIVTDELNENIILATRNLDYIKLVLANELNTYDVIYADKMIATNGAIKYIEEVLK